MPTPRETRLRTDFDRATQLAHQSDGSVVIRRTDGVPPIRYEVLFRIRGIERLERGAPVYRTEHVVIVELGQGYPIQQPLVRFNTRIFHPHVFDHLGVCLGAWTVNEFLDNLLQRVVGIIAYDPSYIDFKSPANREAANWAQRNLNSFPLDRLRFKREEAKKAPIIWWNQ